MENYKKKKVLIVTTSFPRRPGDFSGIFIFNLLSRLADNFEIYILAPYSPRAKKFEEWSGLSVYRFKYFWPFSWQQLCHGPGIVANLKRNKFLVLLVPFLMFFLFINLIYLVKKEKIEIVNAHWILPTGLVTLLARVFFRRPLIVTSHGPDILVLKGRVFDWLRKITLKKAEAVTFISKTFAKQATNSYNIDLSKVAVISMGVDTELFCPSIEFKKQGEKQLIQKFGFLPTQPILFFVGSLAKHKGIDYLIQAMKKIVLKFPSTNLLIAGEGHLRTDLEKLARNLGLERKVFFLGGINNKDLPPFYNLVNVFVLPSLVEGLPVAIMEAMSCGCPVIATPVGGVADLIENGVTGLLIKTKSEEAITQAVIKLLSDNTLRESIIQNARKKIEENYDWNIIASKFEKLYDKVSIK
ncbi:MAG: glycosyltransferase [bacterium]